MGWLFPWAVFFDLWGIEGAGDLPDELTVSIALDMMMTEPMTLFMPWMLGGYMLVVLTIPFSYPIYFLLIKGAKAARARVIKRKQEK